MDKIRVEVVTPGIDKESNFEIDTDTGTNDLCDLVYCGDLECDSCVLSTRVPAIALLTIRQTTPSKTKLEDFYIPRLGLPLFSVCEKLECDNVACHLCIINHLYGVK